MTTIRFKAPEYQSDGSFVETGYEFSGDETGGWRVLHGGTPLVRLGRGYTPLRSLYCGVCSTDLARRRLPFPLPQLIGHEAVGLRDGRPVVVDINASHRARDDHPEDCPYCAAGLDTQCPDRLTMGIDRLPGAFAPWFLAPVRALHPVPDDIPPALATLAEPFAAALRGVELSMPRAGDRVAVLGPRRLGMLTLAALAGYRHRLDLDFEIIGVVRHGHLAELGVELGADRVIDIRETPAATLSGRFDIVFDTTGRPGGLETALELSRRIVHIKSTHGEPSLGLSHLTEMVIDELALLPYETTRLAFTPPGEAAPRANTNIYVAPSVPEDLVAEASAAHPAGRFHRLPPDIALRRLADEPGMVTGSPLPRFDLALVSRMEEVDAVIRPLPERRESLLRPVGAILLAGVSPPSAPPLERAVRRGIEIHTSRCGSLARALEVMRANPRLMTAMRRRLVSHVYPLTAIGDAFTTAADSRAMKVLVKTGAHHDSSS